MLELTTTIGNMIRAAQRVEGQNANDNRRADLFDRFMGEPYGDEKKGQSSFLSNDVSDTIEATLPEILEPFTSSEDAMRFDPVGPDDEEAAKQETEVVSHIFWQKNDGFLTLYTWCKEALIQQNSYIKRGWEEKSTVQIDTYEGLTPERLVQVISEAGGQVEFLEQEGFEIGEQGIVPQVTEQGIVPIRVKLRVTKTTKEYKIRCVPQEEVFYTPGWGMSQLDGAPCCGHRREVEIGELIAMGFDPESAKEAQDAHEYHAEQELARRDTKDHESYTFEDEAGDESTRKVIVYESYVRADYNEDGIAELLKVWAVGDGSTILKWADGEDAIEEVSNQPFSAWTPYIVPHRHVGRSQAEMVDDIQLVNTTLIRHTLDNLYKTNYARPQYDETQAGEFLEQDLMDPSPGAAVRTGGAEVLWDRPPSVIDTTLPLLEKFRDLREERTGATRYNQGLDGESLNKTATGMAMINEAGQKRNKLIARIFAETGLRHLFMGIHADLRSGPMQQIAMRLRGQWVEVDPTSWRDRSDMTVQVGIGSGDRAQKREFLGMIGQLIRELLASGAPNVNMEHVYNTAERMAETYGYSSIEPFMMRPEEVQPKPEEPSPQEQMARFQMEMQQQQLAMQAQEAQRKFELEVRKIDLEHARKMEELQLKAAGVRIDADRLELDGQKAIMTDDYNRDKLEVDAETAHMREKAKQVDSKRSQRFRSTPKAKQVDSKPPISYSQVGNDRS